MNSFSNKYPSFAAVLILFATLGKDAFTPGQTALQKLTGAANLIGPLMAFLPQSTALTTEVAVLKSSPSDMEQAGEALVTDFGFTSAKAQAIIAAAFPLAETIANLVIPQTETLVSAFAA